MTAPAQLHQLVERFDYNLADYKAGLYNETQVRREFIDPLFKALGWDIDNEKGYAEAYKEVVHEDAIRVGRATKAPDYSFRIGGVRKFFLEAKKPSINLKDDLHPAFQLRRYAWSAKLPLSILTDFEEFAVYDCRIKPVKTDKPAAARIMYLTYTDYPARWSELVDIFSPEAIRKGAFDKYVDSQKVKKGTAEVDHVFLQEIERWRELLAKNLALRNSLTQRQLNFAVQNIIDRIIFLRIAEDRGIEPYGQLMALQNGPHTYDRLMQLCRRADDRYNSGLFYFREEKGRSDSPDLLTPDLTVDDKVLQDICKHLYYPDSPYEFSVLPADILGQVYEQFLGKVIRLTAGGHRAVVEDKPEVKKAGGVFYTPTYIVDYIVRQTVGQLVEGKTPNQLRGKQPLRIADPACGSGSFLLGAYQYLLNWYRDYYIADPEGPDKWARGRNPRLYQSHTGEWKLTTAERKQILLTHIYGVDIDPQAVEVTKLSLLLKVLEGEDEQSIGRQLAMFQERVLPDLGHNIKCGNSLIGPDFYQANPTQLSMFDEDELYRINAFDWSAEFAQVFEDGGFDAVIGNPPYGAWFKKEEDQYFGGKYEVYGSVRDVYVCFLEQGFRLLKEMGRLGFIIPSAWIGGPAYKKLRTFLLEKQIETLILMPFDVFANAYIDTAIAIVTNATPNANFAVKTHVFGKREKLYQIELSDQSYKTVQQNLWHTTDDNKFVLDPKTIHLMNILGNNCPLTLNDVAIMKRGVLFDKSLLSEKKEGSDYFRYFEGDVYRYQLNFVADNWVEFGDKMKERPKEFDWFEGERILLRRLVNRRQRLMAVLASETFITNKNLYTIKAKNDNAILVILGVLNSSLISYLYLQQVTQATKDDFPQVTIRDILALPFPSTDKVELNKTKLTALVERMLELHRQLAAANVPQTKTVLKRQIEAVDAAIDRLVYELYNLSEAEIKIIEGRP